MARLSGTNLRWIAAAPIIALATAASAAPTNYMGVNTHQPKDHVLDSVKDLGMSWVRIDFNWNQVEPKQGKFTWSHFDKMINAAHARGLKVFPTIGYGPSWATTDQDSKKGTNDCPKPGLYYKVTKAAAAHYKGKITHWGLWNEPNLGGFCDCTMQQWVDRIVVEGVKGIKAGCPSCKVLGPELASVGNKHAQYLEASIVALKKQNLMWDIITHHIYSSFVELDITLLACTGDTFFNDLDSHRKCMLGPVVIYEGPLSPREVLLKHKLGHLPLWLTETGLKAPITDTKKQNNQVTYYRRVMEEQLKRSWWTHTFFYEIIDDNNWPDKWGMATVSGSNPKYPGSYNKKPVWALMQKVLSKQPRYGGSGTDCNDGLDNDYDKKIDYPADTGCSSASDTTETPGAPKPDTGVTPKYDTGVTPKYDTGVTPKYDKGVIPKYDTGVTPKYDQGGTCTYVKCPPGHLCKDGKCVPLGGDGGTADTNSKTTDSAPVGNPGAADPDTGGCTCSVDGERQVPALVLLLVLLAAFGKNALFAFFSRRRGGRDR